MGSLYQPAWLPIITMMNRLNRLAKVAGLFRPSKWLHWGFVAMVMLHTLGGVAWAQRAAHLPEEDGGMLQWGVAAGLVVLVLLPALINPKRTHIG